MGPGGSSRLRDHGVDGLRRGLIRSREIEKRRWPRSSLGPSGFTGVPHTNWLATCLANVGRQQRRGLSPLHMTQMDAGDGVSCELEGGLLTSSSAGELPFQSMFTPSSSRYRAASLPASAGSLPLSEVGSQDPAAPVRRGHRPARRRAPSRSAPHPQAAAPRPAQTGARACASSRAETHHPTPMASAQARPAADG